VVLNFIEFFHMDILNLLELEPAAKPLLSKLAFDYYVGGADDELTVLENRQAFACLALQYRVLRGIEQRQLESTLFGETLSLPVLLAPTAFHKLAHPDGECATATAAKNADTIMVLSTSSSTSLEDVRASQPNLKLWFQLYLFQDLEVSLEVIHRAEAVGAKALVLTVDTPILGRRERDIRNRFTLPNGVEMANFHHTLPDSEGSSLSAHASQNFKPDLSLRDLGWLREHTNLPIVVKGICHHEDAVLALEHGASGIWVSNHGGRQLDTAPATIRVLPRIADAVAGRAPIILDGGVRRGTDVIKALALGANAVAIGRPILWSLAIGGAAGLSQTLELLRGEIDSTLALCGYSNLELPRDLIF
jgi:4-hydroxymandelate oxidase